MTAPIILYMFLNSFAPVVINHNFITTLIFNEEVTLPHTGATKSELYLKKGADGKVLFLQAKNESIETNLNIMTKSGKLYSFLIKYGDHPNSIVNVRDGKKDEFLKDVKKTSKYLIQESNQYAVVSNLTGKRITVNTINVAPKGRLEVPKNAAIFINNMRVWR